MTGKLSSSSRQSPLVVHGDMAGAGVLNLAEVLQDIQSTVLSNRDRGFKNLKQVLGVNRHSNALTAIKEKSLLLTLDQIFNAAALERAAWLKLKNNPTEAATQRLIRCAEGVRAAIESFCPFMRSKSVKVVLGHVIQTLQMADAGICMPLAPDYFKALACLFSYQPHAEHLDNDAWLDAVEFCIQSIESLENNGPGSTSRSTTERASTSKRGLSEDSTISAVVMCLNYLTLPDNCPVIQQAHPISTSMCNFLKKRPNVTGAHHAAFEIVDLCIIHASSHSVRLMTEIASMVLPLIRSFWSTKDHNFCIKMLSILIRLHTHMAAQTGTPAGEALSEPIRAIFDVMEGAFYRKLQKDDNLTLDDVSLTTRVRGSEDIMPLQIPVMALRETSAKTECNWTTVSMIAFCANWLDIHEHTLSRTRESDLGHERSPKRRKVSSVLHGLITQLNLDGNLFNTLGRLQILTFMVGSRRIQDSEIDTIVTAVTQLVSHDKNEIASWAMLLLASCAFQGSVRAKRNGTQWAGVWHLCARAISTPLTCRVACHLGDILLRLGHLEYEDIKDLLNDLFFSDTLNGPAILCDSALSLWSTVCFLRAAHVPSQSALKGFHYALSWIRAKWAPENFENKSSLHQVTCELNASSLVVAFQDILGRRRTNPLASQFACLDALGQAWRWSLHRRDFSDWLLLPSRDDWKLSDRPDWAAKDEKHANLAEQHSMQLANPALTFFMEKVETVYSKFTVAREDRVGLVTTDMLQSALNLCLVGSEVSVTYIKGHGKHAQGLAADCCRLATLLVEIAAQSEDNSQMDMILKATAPLLPPMTLKNVSKRVLDDIKPLNPLLLSMNRNLSMESYETGTTDLGASMENENGTASFASVHLQDRKAGKRETRGRSVAAASSDPLSFRVCMIASLKLLGLIWQSSEAEDVTETIPETFFEFLESLPDRILFGAQPLLKLIRQGSFVIEPSDAENLLVRVAGSALSNYEWTSCQLAACLNMEIMSATATLWTDSELGNLASVGADCYNWLLDIALEGGMCSTAGMLQISDLFFQLLQLVPDYAETLGRPSIRTTLFEMIRDADVFVQYHIAQRLPQIFESFVLGQHAALFDDIVENLPRDIEQKEGICIRLTAFACIGGAWPNLLHVSLYNIFDTVANIPEISRHGKESIDIIVSSLEIRNGQRLFELFSSQVLFTWLENNPLSKIPFEIFGFEDLKAMIQDARHELSSFCIMRGNQEQLRELGTFLGMDEKAMLTDSFTQAIAYSMARDIALSCHDAEGRIRDILGKTPYVQLLRQHFHDVVVEFFLHLEDEENIEKAMAKRTGYEQALKSLKSVNSLSQVPAPMSQSQQPSWGPTSFLDQVERLCRRVSRDPGTIWTSAIVVKVARALLNSVDRVYGPTHTCRIMERLKILICLAGTEACSGFALNLLSGGLRSFVADKHASIYAIPLLQHLLSSGRNSNLTDIGFIAELSIPLLLSMRNLLDSRQDSTTQESTHRQMLSRAQEFRTWLCDFLTQYQTLLTDTPALQTFQKLMDSAKIATNKCSANIHTAEGQLLKCLLEEYQPHRSILSRYAIKTCLLIVGKDFDSLPRWEDDIINTGVEAARLAFALWDSMQLSNLSSNYLIWASRALGLAYRYYGQVDERITSETYLKYELAPTVSKALAGDVRVSKQKIVQLISEQLTNPSSRICGLAETALNSIVVAYEGSEDFDLFTNHMSDSLVKTFIGTDRMTTSPALNHEESSLTIWDSFNCLTKDSVSVWALKCVSAVLDTASPDPILNAVRPLIRHEIEGFSEALLPLILHIVLNMHHTHEARDVETVSESFNRCFEQASKDTTSHLRVLLNTFLYLRIQRKPRESTHFDRNRWLDIDLERAATAAKICGLPKTALMLLEIWHDKVIRDSYPKASRHSSAPSEATIAPPYELILEILKTIDEPDAFYGIELSSDLYTIAERLEYEGDDIHSLLYRGAQTDSLQRMSKTAQSNTSSELLPSLTRLSLNALVNTIVMSSSNTASSSETSNSLLTAALKLGHWDVPIPTAISTTTGVLYKTLQGLKNATSFEALEETIRKGFMDTYHLDIATDITQSKSASIFETMAALSELDSLIHNPDAESFATAVAASCTEFAWMRSTSVNRVSAILVSREAFAGIISGNPIIRQMLKLGTSQALVTEAKIILRSTQVYRLLGAQQEALSAVTYLSRLAVPLKESGLPVDASVNAETARILWDRGELVGSIKTLKGLCAAKNLSEQMIPVGKAGIFAELAHHVSEARSEKPDEVLTHYLRPALKELGNSRTGPEAGKVFHEYATYCHNQLENADTIEELRRGERFVEQKKGEIKDLSRAMSTASETKERDAIKKQHNSVIKWLKIDETEVIRLQRQRQEFLKLSLEHYLRSLAASDEYDTDVVRFLAIWFANVDSDIVSPPVQEYSTRVPSRKFTNLMNQLGSRLQDADSKFQTILGDLVMRICVDHPYHGMHHVFAGSKSSGGHDSQAQSRQGAATRIAARLKEDKRTSGTWARIHRSNELYNRMAILRSKQIKSGAKLQMKDFEESKKILREVPGLKVPPITLNIAIRDDCNYSDVPVVSAFRSEFSVPGGNSVPKIVTAHASDGNRYRQLFKGGLDDLRQDAIMEQVFEQVTGLLQHNKATRIRKLSIRTYKVVPLDSTSGAIEFVEPTVSLMEYLDPAHQRYYPKDLTFSVARNKMREASDSTQSAKVKVYESICNQFHPVLHHFFFERYVDPEDWFDKRLAYTRSTAAISILGHILGLGDRHCQNILLDTSTGEVVHIDLGVAFEAGRILPKPETVPFRLTRDIVDGFGILKTEGVFRRCCEFTLEALRGNKDTILTLLNVLRYDPLYSWSVSPLRARRMQIEQESRMQGGDLAASTREEQKAKRQGKGGGAAEEVDLIVIEGGVQRHSEDSGEAERALGTVERKLAGGLSVSAAVNELIQQATDEKNLAVLFQGWAPFA